MSHETRGRSLKEKERRGGSMGASQGEEKDETASRAEAEAGVRDHASDGQNLLGLRLRDEGARDDKKEDFSDAK